MQGTFFEELSLRPESGENVGGQAQACPQLNDLLDDQPNRTDIENGLSTGRCARHAKLCRASISFYLRHSLWVGLASSGHLVRSD